ncbi:MAG: hypothetical protein NVSMB49_16100 [Ktedonobacteraceae bacterium]
MNPGHFGKLFTYPVQGDVYAQPLYVSKDAFPNGGIHNVVYIATMTNRVYAFDADDPNQATTALWQRSLEPSIPLPDPNIGPAHYQDLLGQTARRDVGIVSTPVISLTHNAIYVVTASRDPNKSDVSAYSHHLHALDLATGADKFAGPIQIQATIPGTGDGSRNGQITFMSNRQNQRSALLLANDSIYIAFAGYGDQDSYHGWTLAYSASTLKPSAVFTTTPTGGRGGIWQAGQGPAADEQNNIYVLTGNGTFQDSTEFSSSFVKLRPNLTVLDWFTPFNQQALSDHDVDVGSAGALLIPGTDLLIGGGKEGKLFLMKRESMGHYQPALGNSQIVQNFYIIAPENPHDPIGSAANIDGRGHHVHGGPVFWNGPQGRWIYVWVEEDVLKAFALLPNGIFDTEPTSSPIKGFSNPQQGIPSSRANVNGLGGAPGKSPGMPGAMLSISANGNTVGTGILWASHPLDNANQKIVPGILRAYDASDLSKELWNSRVNMQNDDIGNFAKFCPPTIANGRVYVASFSNAVVVYGRL